MPDPEPLPRLDPVDAIAFFRAKGWEIGFDWQDLWQEEHVRAFTVAKAMSRDLLEDIRAAVDTALSEGLTLRQFADELRPRLVARGWWGRKWMTDPQTGESKVVQLGSPARLRTIYETNLRTSYMAGRWQRIEKSKQLLPFVRYVSVMDGRERPEHHAWHGTILPVDDPWWDTHFPPCGWGCRCEGVALNQRTIDRRGWQVEEPQRFPERDYINRRTGEVTRLERGIDPGWSYNVGKASLDALTPAPRIGGMEGEDQALNAFSDADFGAVRGFFSAFGLNSRDAALRGRVWTDAAGWPQAISLGLLRRADGSMARPDARQAKALAIAAKILTAPDSIGLAWITGQDGRALLARRYVSAAGVVDLARDFWRWHAGSPRRFERGLVIWTREDGVLAAYDPRQLRHGKGSRDGGRFRRTGRPEARAAIGSPSHPNDIKPFKAVMLGAVGSEAVGAASRRGIDIAGRGVLLDHSAARHIIGRHGQKAARRKGERAMTGADLMGAHHLVNSAHAFTREGAGHSGMMRIAAHTKGTAGEPIRIILDVSKRNLRIVTMFNVA